MEHVLYLNVYDVCGCVCMHVYGCLLCFACYSFIVPTHLPRDYGWKAASKLNPVQSISSQIETDVILYIVPDTNKLIVLMNK